MSPDSTASFRELGLKDKVLRAIEDIGYESPTAIQAACIPIICEGRDLIGMAQTGTGKTAAFALPLLGRIDLHRATPQALVLTPTRELAIQVAEAFQSYARELPGFHVLPIYGGQDIRAQLRPLRRGVHVVVGTPGRIADHLRQETLDLTNLKAVVLDEADEMLRMGFLEDVEWILSHTPEQRQTALFSATLAGDVERIAQRYLSEAQTIRIQGESLTASGIEQRYWIVDGVHKLDALTRLLEIEEFEAMLIFVRTRGATTQLAEKLEARGFPAAALNGDMNQAARESVIDRLKRGTLKIVVATDVAARGIDVEHITHVLNFDIPHDSEAYVHRIGRTGRAGRRGVAILFVAPRERRLLRQIEYTTRQPLTRMDLPTHHEVTKKRIERFHAAIENTIATQDLAYYQEVVVDLRQRTEHSLEDIAGALTFLLQKDRPFKLEEMRSKREPRNRKFEGGFDHDRESGRRTTARMQRFRVEVGKRDGVRTGDIVGAVANEAGIRNRVIGKVIVHDDYTTVDLPAGMPPDLLDHMQRVEVKKKPLRMQPIGAEFESPVAPPPKRPPHLDRPGKRPGFKKGPRFHPGNKPRRRPS
ncbi:MAG: DEAD/DEAH box helicase [Planctomycetes bacterium]|nr:DEAD/DEAH box helicase [Planctomycetota bacterium]